MDTTSRQVSGRFRSNAMMCPDSENDTRGCRAAIIQLKDKLEDNINLFCLQ